MSRRITGAFNRVEGDLEVRIEVEGDRVRDAWVISPLFRGFEQMLEGKAPEDALVYVPRICGICSVSQSVAAARALAAAQGIEPTANGHLAANLILACENLADHLTHFYLFFMPDFARPEAYDGLPWFEEIAARFRAQTGSAAREVLPARAAFLHLTGILAGKWPHTLAIQPGGTTVAVDAARIARLRMILHGFRDFLERTLFGDCLEAVAEIDSEAALWAWVEEGEGDFRRFLRLAGALKLEGLGRAQDRFMSFGVYPDEDGETLFPAGIATATGGREPLDTAAIREDLSHAWLRGGEAPRHPRQGVTRPHAPDDGPAYTWCKAPRLAGEPMEVGALARQQVAGHPLIRDLVRRSGGNVRNRVIARLLEIARVVPEMEGWLAALRPGEPFCRHGRTPEAGEGEGLAEAARGSLGHWLQVRDGRIANYQIIAPTTWNFSPRDAEGRPGPLEQALIGAPVRPGEREPVAVQHIVRSFDPCMVCTVH